jgi:stress response protein YsnF
MNRIVKEHYPASKLPEDLRTGVDPAATVTITIVEEVEISRKDVSLEEIFASRRPPFRSTQEIDEALRRQRDEWND